MPQSVSSVVRQTVCSFPVGTQFTISDLKENHLPALKANKNTIVSAVDYLKRTGIIKKVNNWDGLNSIKYEVVDNSRPKPSTQNPAKYLEAYRKSLIVSGQTRPAPIDLSKIPNDVLLSELRRRLG